jgi:hypothetical protein
MSSRKSKRPEKSSPAVNLVQNFRQLSITASIRIGPGGGGGGAGGTLPAFSSSHEQFFRAALFSSYN